MALNVAVIEDDPLIQMALRSLVKSHESCLYPTLESFMASSDLSKAWDLVLLDLCHAADPEGAGTISRLPELRRRLPMAEIIVQSGLQEIEIMRACVRNGASRFLMKEHIGDEVPALLTRFAELKELRTGIDQKMVGESPVMKRLKSELLSFRFETRFDVLIEGETGSGKELCAQVLHSGGPFIPVNVSAIPAELFESEFFGSEKGAYTGAAQSRAGHFEMAGTGTLFLDEIQSLSPSHQAKLLRVLEVRAFTRVGSSFERPLKARVVCASNLNLREAVSKGTFREDLYYRIAPLTVQVPPLRMRGSDIGLLAKKFLREFDQSQKLSFTPAGIRALENEYDWPGNVRELRGLVRNLVLKANIPFLDSPEICEALQKNDNQLVSSPPQGNDAFAVDWSLGFDENVARLEQFLLEMTLRDHKSVEAREKLKLARSRFYEKVKQYKVLQ
jgi:DNA-binding NtrC family response regulator